MAKNRRRRSFPIAYLFPNIVTLAGLCAGLSAVRFAMLERWELSLALIMVAAIIDGMDGRLARMLNATSNFGAQLDSLADFVSFGIAPVLVLYMWQLQHIKGLGWLVVLVYGVCCALRLARFNSAIFDESAKSKKENQLADEFFTGVPAPAGAMLTLIPLAMQLGWADSTLANPTYCMVWVLFTAFLMVSTIPTISAKKFRIKHHYAAPLLVLSGLWVAGMIIEPWITFTLSAAIYLLLIPYSVARHARMKREISAGGGASEED